MSTFTDKQNEQIKQDAKKAQESTSFLIKIINDSKIINERSLLQQQLAADKAAAETAPALTTGNLQQSQPAANKPNISPKNS